MPAPRLLILKMVSSPAGPTWRLIFQIVADAGHHLAAVAPGTAVAQIAAFENGDVGDAPLSQLQRGVDAGEAAADDHHVDVQILFQRREAQIVFLVAA